MTDHAEAAEPSSDEHGDQESNLASSTGLGEDPRTPPAMPTSQPVLIKALKWGLLATVVLVVACGGIGWLIAEGPGLVGGVLGALIAGVFLSLTVGSIAFGNRFIENPNYLVIFFGLVVGGWVLKFVAFIVAALVLRDQPWLNPQILFFSLIAGVIVSLVIDAVVMLKSRIPIIPMAP